MQIIPQKCRYKVMSTKIEIRLAKAEPVHWTSLEYTREIAVVQRPNVSSGTRSYTCEQIISSCKAAVPFPLLCVHYFYLFVLLCNQE